MVKVEITVDGFMSGARHIEKGGFVEVAQPIADYIIRNKEGKLFSDKKDKPSITRKKAPPRKAQYKTRDMEAE